MIKELSKYEIYSNSENEHLPDHIQLAGKLNNKQTKMNKIIKDLFNHLITDLYDHPLTVKDVVHFLHIHHYRDPDERKNIKDEANFEWGKAISI